MTNITKISKADKNFKGVFGSLTELQTQYPVGNLGDFAILSDLDQIYTFDTTTSSWVSTGGGGGGGVTSLDLQTGDLTLKTINGINLLGSGNITLAMLMILTIISGYTISSNVGELIPFGTFITGQTI